MKEIHEFGDPTNVGQSSVDNAVTYFRVLTPFADDTGFISLTEDQFLVEPIVDAIQGLCALGFLKVVASGGTMQDTDGVYKFYFSPSFWNVGGRS
jgi:hypothetical protein